MQTIQHIAERAAAEGREPDEAELREAVSAHVLDGVLAGYKFASDDADPPDSSQKRRRDE